MDLYASGLWHVLGHVRLGGGFTCCWHQWIGNHTSNVWNLIPSCLMLIVWLECKYYSFEDTKKMLEELFVLCQHSPFDWSRCWDFINFFSLPEFMHSLRIISGFLSSYCCCCCCFFFFLFFPIVHHHDQLVFFLLFSLIIFLLITCKKKNETCMGKLLQVGLSWMLVVLIENGRKWEGGGGGFRIL